MKATLLLRKVLLASVLTIGLSAVFTDSSHGAVYSLSLTTDNSGGLTLASGDNTFSFSNFSVDYLIVAGGGGGGSTRNNAGRGGGGGGAGGLLQGTGLSISGSQTIVVGAGGAGGVGGAANPSGANGGNSSAFSLTAIGGGGGGSNVGTTTGKSGGSGGGAGSITGGATGGAATIGQGNDGGSSNDATGGGGGGAGGVGTRPTGGAGLNLSITGSSVTYAQGGNGGNAVVSATPAAATANTGNGGLGIKPSSNAYNGGAGGSGIVVVRYSGPQVLSGGTVSSDGSGNTVHQFLSTGSSTLDLHSATIAGTIDGSGNLVWNKTGVLNLTGDNSYSGATTISSGTLAVSGTGDINQSSGITIGSGATFRYNSSTALTVGTITNNGGTISGTGKIGATVLLDSTSDILAPGNSPGIQEYTVAQSWASFTYQWEIDDFNGTVGNDYDQIQITGGGLALTGSTAGSYIVDVGSLLGLAPGDLTGFSETTKSWEILTATGGITGTGFNTAYWSLDTSGFTTAFNSPEFSGTWSLSTNDTASTDSIILTYTAIPEPGAALLGGLGILLILRRGRVD